MYLTKHMSAEAHAELAKFIASQPYQITNLVYLETKGDTEKGTEYFVKLFMRTSDYAKKTYGWINERMDAVKVVHKKKKVEDPNSLSNFLNSMGGGCDCGSCGGH